MAVFVLRKAGGGSSLRGADVFRLGSPSGSQVTGSASSALTLSAVATGSIRPGASGTAFLVLSASATAGNWANGAAAVGDASEAATLRLSAYATGFVEVPVEPAPAGTDTTPIKRVSVTMPAPTLDANGRPV